MKAPLICLLVVAVAITLGAALPRRTAPGCYRGVPAIVLRC